MKHLVLIAAAAAALVLPTAISAHPNPKSWGSGVPGIHKICASVGVCSDKAPKPGPEHECHASNSGELAKVWDPKLGAYVIWRCLCVESGCRWVRVRIVQRARLPWEQPCYRYVIDFHRACASIVCTYVAREHRYAVRGSYWGAIVC